MVTEHKYADILRAIADDDSTEIEVLEDGNWYDTFIWDVIAFPAREYRIKPCKPCKPCKIDWDSIDTRYKYIAKDKSGTVYAYVDKPLRCTEYWIQSPLYGFHLGHSVKLFDVEIKGDWQNSLQKRPSNV